MNDYRQLFVENTLAVSYSARVASVISFDVRDQRAKVDVPTLLITPEDDKLVGERAARELPVGLPAARDVVLARTRHMFRFTLPSRTSTARPLSISSAKSHSSIGAWRVGYRWWRADLTAQDSSMRVSVRSALRRDPLRA